MTLLLIWAVIAVCIFAALSYSIGRTVPKQDSDIPGMFFVASAVSIFWPVVLALTLICGPFYFPYKLGVRNREKALEKEKMWDTLKK